MGAATLAVAEGAAALSALSVVELDDNLRPSSEPQRDGA